MSLLLLTVGVREEGGRICYCSVIIYLISEKKRTLFIIECVREENIIELTQIVGKDIYDD